MIQVCTVKTARFQKDLRDHLVYRTSSETRHLLLDRLFGWSNTWYYLRQCQIIFSGYITACRGKFDRPAWSGRAWRILNVIEAAGGDIAITGLENIATLKPPVVYVANHMSMMETMLLPGAIILAFHDVTTVVKESLLSYPAFGKIMRALKPIVVARKDPRKDLRTVLEEGKRSLQNGTSVLLFPQSTRTPHFDPAQFNSLGAKLAARAGVPLVPVALKTDFQGVGRLLRDVGPLHRDRPIRFAFGTPIPPDRHPKHIHQASLDFITGQLRDWGVHVGEQ